MSGVSLLFRGARVALACALAFAAAPLAADSGRQLVLLNWAEYVDPSVLEDFTAETGIVVVERFFASDVDRDSQIAQAEPGEIDVAMVSGAHLHPLRRWGWAAPLTEAHAANLRHVEPRWFDAYVDSRGYSAPMMWGTLGIAWRTDLVDTPLSRWRDLLEPAPRLCGKIWMLPDGRELIDFTRLALGYGSDHANLEELSAAREMLLRQKPCVGDYAYPSLSDASVLVTGEAAAAILYNGDAASLRNLEPNIDYAVPSEGSYLWVDYLVISASSRNREAAYRFIDFLHRPDIAARMAEYLNFATTNGEATPLLPAEMRRDPWIYPPQDVMERTSIEAPLPLELIRPYNRIGVDVVPRGSGTL